MIRAVGVYYNIVIVGLLYSCIVFTSAALAAHVGGDLAGGGGSNY